MMAKGTDLSNCCDLNLFQIGLDWLEPCPNEGLPIRVHVHVSPKPLPGLRPGE